MAEAGGPILTVCGIPTFEYGTGSVTDYDARLISNHRGRTLTCRATIGEPLPARTVVLSGQANGPIYAGPDGLETYDWELKISFNGQVTLKCSFPPE